MIRVEGICKRYGVVTAVDSLSFEVARGETFAVIGPNGAGKTTTLKCLLGLVRPDSGRIAIGEEGLPPTDPRARRTLGYVPQRAEFSPGRSVSQLLGFFAELRGLGREAVTRALTRVGLGGHADRRASELSGGYIQRLSLAQALLGDPELLILDEPTASLDPEATWEFRSLVLQLKHEGKTILLCSHLLAEVERVADRVLILVGGRGAAMESATDLRARQVSATHMVVELEEPSARASALLTEHHIEHTPVADRALAVNARNGRFLEALEVLRAARVQVRSVEMQRPTLEEVFLAVVRGERHAEQGGGRS